MVEMWIPIVMFVSFFATVSYAFNVVNRRRATEATARAEVQNRLVDKFGSSKEFVDFLQTESGRDFLSPMAAADAPRAASAYDKILRTLNTGVVLAVFGAAALVLALIFADEAVPIVFAGLVLSLGVGFLLSAGVSYRLSRSWGLIEPKRSEAAS